MALKSAEKSSSLGTLFLAVQFVDILFFSFVLMGIEQLDVIENFTASTHFALPFMPYTHSLLASLLWAVGAYVFFKFIIIKQSRVAVVAAIAILSHWFLDLVVHTPDLPILIGNTYKIGFGLWNHPIATYILEAVLLIGALFIYLRKTESVTLIGRYGMTVFVTALLVINATNIFGPPFGTDVNSLSISALLMYFLFAGIAYLLDTKRY